MLFEPHADIIVKGIPVTCSMDTSFNLATGQSGLILDVVHRGSAMPADAERFLPMLERQIARCGAPPPMAVMPVRTISPPPRRAASRMSPSTRSAAWRSKIMVKSRWVYRKLRNFRAGIEAAICLLA